ncbi:MAG: hypothetical protein AAGM40_04290 [Cyanobacteria bacterium J06573_2]
MDKSRNIFQQNKVVMMQRLKLLFSRFIFFLSSPSSIICIHLLVLSIILIGLPYLLGKKSIEDEYLEILQDIGSDLFGGACAFLAFEIIWQRFKKNEEDRGSILDYFSKKEFINAINRSTSARKRQKITLIKIMQTWTDLLINQDDKEEFKDAIIESLQAETALIQILLLNPENQDLVESRSEDLSHLGINLEENIYANIRELQTIYKALKKLGLEERIERIEIKLYNINPSIAIYMCSPSLFVNFMRKGQITTRGEQLKLSMDSDIAKFIDERFNEVWDDSNSIPLNDFLYLKLQVIEECNNTVNKIRYNEVKYVQHEDFYYIQHHHLFNNIANRTDIKIKVIGKKQSFQAINIMEEELDYNVMSSFRHKYLEIERYFFLLKPL